jgi:threonine synthase
MAADGEGNLPAYVCACGEEHPPTLTRWRCDCGGLLGLAPGVAAPAVRDKTTSLWQYQVGIAGGGILPWPVISLGEGGTPLVRDHEPSGADVRLKLEFVSPTGSFKDRGAVVVVALALAVGARRVVADSSGNAGTAVAAYAARAGLDAEILVPVATSPKKLAQIRGHGATVTTVSGGREETAAAAIARVEAGDAFYASHVYNPYFYEGTKTYALEAVDQLDGDHHPTFVVPAGNGTLVLGVHRACVELLAADRIPALPRIVAVQSEQCAPLATPDRATGPTIAEGIAIATPPRRDDMLRAIDETGGAVVTVAEAEITQAQATLARQGLWVEPTGAVAYAATTRLVRTGSPLVAASTPIVPLCGTGLKSS